MIEPSNEPPFFSNISLSIAPQPIARAYEPLPERTVLAGARILAGARALVGTVLNSPPIFGFPNAIMARGATVFTPSRTSSNILPPRFFTPFLGLPFPFNAINARGAILPTAFTVSSISPNTPLPCI